MPSAFAGDWVAMVGSEEGKWRWRVATFGRDAGGGLCATEDDAKRAAEVALRAAVKR
ncbi:hypothetical protein [Azospirillum sp. TSA2s]|uniref:hypothetical protein n=1 Tax=Azospirillum sp. TSA2s TaxID=709810 RepID=UPI00145C0560|nr:hypothetical protein [Azospirillum sp. TSA2s]